MSGVLYCESIDKSYQQGPQKLQILRNLEFRVAAREHLAIVGDSISRTPALFISRINPSRNYPKTPAANCAINISALFINSIICSPNSVLWKMLLCHC
jgi:ABC-type microcin C transport system duplicated ATPase subunit YejF